ncbi:MAG TPA: VanZ family protein [Gemmatimonadales bacterium]|nr:VanZ family protein [Gemmatimonadales bacterium]
MTSPPTATGRRLGALFLGYLTAVVAVITLAPFRFARPAHFEASLLVTDGGWATDVVLNVVLFVPLGLLWQRMTGMRAATGFVAGLLVGTLIETAQLFLAPRYTTLSDLLANGAGAWLGALLSLAVARRVASTELVTRLWLDQPLMGLVSLLVPLTWLVGLGSVSDPSRLWLLVPLGSAAALAIAAVATVTRVPGDGRAPLVPALGAALLWSGVAVVPALRVSLSASAMGLVATLIMTVMASMVWRVALRRERRLEPQVVRALMPLLLVVLWGLTRGGGSLALRGGGEAAREGLLRVLAELAAFTLLGYLVAEGRGRRLEPLRRLLWWPFLTALAVTLVVGILQAPWLSPLRVAAVLTSAAFGAVLYDAQRAHIMSLLGRS